MPKTPIKTCCLSVMMDFYHFLVFCSNLELSSPISRGDNYYYPETLKPSYMSLKKLDATTIYAFTRKLMTAREHTRDYKMMSRDSPKRRHQKHPSNKEFTE